MGIDLRGVLDGFLALFLPDFLTEPTVGFIGMADGEGGE